MRKSREEASAVRSPIRKEYSGRDIMTYFAIQLNILFSDRSQVLEVVRRLVDDFNGSTAAPWQKAKIHQKLVTLLLYTCIPPGRGRCYRTLRISKGEVSDVSPQENTILVGEDTLLLSITSLKTSRTLVRREIDLRVSIK